MALLHPNATVQPAKWPVILAAHFPDEIQGLCVVANYDDPVISAPGGSHNFHESVKGEHFSGPFGKDRLLTFPPPTRVRQELIDALSPGCRRRLWSFIVRNSGLSGVAPGAGRRVLSRNEARVIAKLHEHLYGREAVDLLAVDGLLHRFASDKVGVNVFLNVRHLAAYDLNELGRKVLGINFVLPA